MKVRIGYSPGTASSPADLDRFAELVDGLERHRFDSVWVPEVLTASTLDPLTALAYAAGRTERLKLGTHLVVPGRGPARLAKELATLDRLSRGRLLLTFVIGLPQGPELSAYGVDPRERTGRLDETVAVLRRLWAGEVLEHTGRFFTYDGVAVQPRPWQQPLEIWFGGMAPAALRRCGRLADGWIAGFIPPAQAAAAKAVIDEAAAAAGRVVDPEHFGMNLLYRRGALAPEARIRLGERFPALDAAAVDALVPDVTIAGQLDERIAAYLAAGCSKFVLRPAHRVPSWDAELAELAEVVHRHHRPG